MTPGRGDPELELVRPSSTMADPKTQVKHALWNVRYTPRATAAVERDEGDGTTAVEPLTFGALDLRRWRRDGDTVAA